MSAPSTLRRQHNAAHIRRELDADASFFRSYIRITCDDDAPQRLSRFRLDSYRRGVASAMRELGKKLAWSSGKSKAKRYELCGRAGIEIVRECIHQGDRKLYAPYACSLRTCPECARRRQAEVARKYAEVLHGEVMALPSRLRKGKRFRLVTLTRVNPGGYDPERLRVQVRQQRRFTRELWYRSWGSYRQARQKASDVGVGAVFGIEVAPPSGEGSGGMVHTHMLVWGDYWAQEDLKRLWTEITGDGSYIVDIREVRIPWGDPIEGIAAGVREVLKYATKPLDGSSPEHIAAVAAIEYAFDGTRRLDAYGIFYGKLRHYAELLDEVEQLGLFCPTCGAPAHAGRIHGPAYMIEEFRHGATWHPQYDPGGGG